MYEVHAYAAKATFAASGKFPRGEKHALLLFLRQPDGAEIDLAAAEQFLAKEGWVSPEFQQTGIADPNGDLENMAELHRTALDDGGIIIVYADPL